MIAGKQEIGELVAIFRERGVLLYHACQLKDLESYMELGGIPSRNLLEVEGKPYTAFETDEQDRRNRVWDKVFLNLEDFGWIFYNGMRRGKAYGVPNPYGPISLAVEPDALLRATDVAISFTSAGSQKFNRQDCAINVGEVQQLFWRPHGHHLLRKDKLAEAFGKDRREIWGPEMSCAIAEEMVPKSHISMVRVDSYSVRGVGLKSYVSGLVDRNEFGREVRERSTPLYRELADALNSGYRELLELSKDPACSAELRTWAKELCSEKEEVVRLQWPRFARYLREGTIEWLTERGAHAP